jgi:hypothetical protein
VEARKVGLLGRGWQKSESQHSQSQSEISRISALSFLWLLIPGQTHRLHFLRFLFLVTVELAKAESKPRDQQKRPTKEALVIATGWRRNASREIESDLLWALKSH